MSLKITAAEHHKAIAWNEHLNNEVDYVDFDGVLRQEVFYRTTEDVFDSELTTYSCLQDLQDVGIPHCYASGNLAVDLLHPISHVLILEYVPGESLTMINPNSVPPLLLDLLPPSSTFPPTVYSTWTTTHRAPLRLWHPLTRPADTLATWPPLLS